MQLFQESKKRSRRRQWQCSRKRAFQTEGYAEIYLAHIRATQDASMGKYLCPFCGNWHLGHEPKKKKRI